jgi:cyclopropane fatty-acyl-phospholipid synthase-like methyltransferase
MTAHDLRSRIYGQYISARFDRSLPATLEDVRRDSWSLHRVVQRHFPPQRDAAILDLGCGLGSLIDAARHAGYTRAVGVDRSREQVEQAARLGIEGVVEVDIIEFLAQTPSSSQDVVVTFDVIEHFTREELLPFVDEIHRVLKTGGRWIIHVPNGESPLSNRIRYGDFTHEQAYTQSSLAQLLLSSGFSSLKCYEDTPLVHGVASAARYVVWKVMRGMLRLYLMAETGNTGRTAIFTQNLLAVAIK